MERPTANHDYSTQNLVISKKLPTFGASKRIKTKILLKNEEISTLHSVFDDDADNKYQRTSDTYKPDGTVRPWRNSTELQCAWR